MARLSAWSLLAVSIGVLIVVAIAPPSRQAFRRQLSFVGGDWNPDKPSRDSANEDGPGRTIDWLLGRESELSLIPERLLQEPPERAEDLPTLIWQALYLRDEYHQGKLPLKFRLLEKAQARFPEDLTLAALVARTAYPAYRLSRNANRELNPFRRGMTPALVSALNLGMRREPDNAFWFAIEAMRLWAAGKADEARAAWSRAAACKRYETHLKAEPDAVLQAVREQSIDLGAPVDTHVYMWTLLPHLAQYVQNAESVGRLPVSPENDKLRLDVIRVARCMLHTKVPELASAIELLVAARMIRQTLVPQDPSLPASQRLQTKEELLVVAERLGPEATAAVREGEAMRRAADSLEDRLLTTRYGRSMAWGALLWILTGSLAVMALGRSAERTTASTVLLRVVLIGCALGLSIWAVGNSFLGTDPFVPLMILALVLIIRASWGRGRRPDPAMAVAAVVGAIAYVGATAWDIREERRLQSELVEGFRMEKRFQEEAGLSMKRQSG